MATMTAAMAIAGKTMPVRRNRPFFRRALRVPGSGPVLEARVLDAPVLEVGRPVEPRPGPLPAEGGLDTGAATDGVDSRTDRDDAGSSCSSIGLRCRDNAVLSV